MTKKILIVLTSHDPLGDAGVVPMLVENRLIVKRWNYSKSRYFMPHVKSGGSLVTGQNPASSETVALAALKLLSND